MGILGHGCQGRGGTGIWGHWDFRSRGLLTQGHRKCKYWDYHDTVARGAQDTERRGPRDLRDRGVPALQRAERNRLESCGLHTRSSGANGHLGPMPAALRLRLSPALPIAPSGARRPQRHRRARGCPGRAGAELQLHPTELRVPPPPPCSALPAELRTARGSRTPSGAPSAFLLLSLFLGKNGERSRTRRNPTEAEAAPALLRRDGHGPKGDGSSGDSRGLRAERVSGGPPRPSPSSSQGRDGAYSGRSFI